MRFRDRADAGRALATLLADRHLPDPVVLALPRGGVPVAAEVANALGAPLDVLVARKVGAPHQPEYGIGAVAEGGASVRDVRALKRLGMSDAEFDALVARETEEIERRVARYRGGRPLPELRDRDVVLVDDGLATGVTAEAAAGAVRAHQPRLALLAVPACAPDSAARLRTVIDDVVCAIEPRSFHAVAQWYDVFDQTTDDEVVALLDAGRVHDR